MKLDRRQAFALMGAAAATATATPAANAQVAVPAGFHHGVASGDPLADRVILWTRLSPGPDLRSLAGEVIIATDAALTRNVRKVPVTTSDARDFTLKVDVTGLKPGTEYWYQFRIDRAVSPIGRTRTLPQGATKDVVLAVATCALYPGGFFNAYEAIGKLERVDAVVHLGDYIYEYGVDGYGGEIGQKIGRLPDPPTEIISLDDYRRRHAQVKADKMVQLAHARAPWIVVWDDHEVCNDTWMGGGENHNPDKGEGSFSDRKAAALKAYYEWMPIREPKTADLIKGVERSFQFGDVASLIMVETRLGARGLAPDYPRDLIVDGKPDPEGFRKKWRDPSRQMMGEAQEHWLAGELTRSVKAGVAWQVLGNQVVMANVLMPDLKAAMKPEVWTAMIARLPDYARDPVAQSGAIAALGLPYNLDAWDGYPAARERVYDVFKATKARPIVLAGDSHAFWVNELNDERDKSRVAVEFGTTGITSPGFGDVLGPDVPLDHAFSERNADVIYTNQSAKGFVLLTLTRDQAKGELVAVSTVYAPKYESSVLKTYTVGLSPAGGVGPMTEVPIAG